MSSGALRAAWEAAQKKPVPPVVPRIASESTASAPDQAARRAEQSGRPLLESIDLPFGVQRDVNAAAQGATFGFSDELAAGLRHLGGQPYDDAIASERAGLAKFKTEHPGRAFVDELLGGAASTAVLPGGAAAKGAGAVARIGRAATTGVFAGGISGAGSAEGGIQNRAVGALGGAATGLVLGGALGAAGEGFRRIPGIVRPETSDQAANRMLRDALLRDEVPMSEAVTRAQAFTPDKPASVLDLGGRNIVRLGRSVRTQPGKGGNVLDTALTERGAGAEERTINDAIATTGLGGRVNAFKKAEDLIAEQKARARPAYEKAYAGPPIDHPDVLNLLKDPDFRDAYTRGARIAKKEGINFPELSSGTRDPVTIRDANGRLRQNLGNVSDEHLNAEYQRLAEMNAQEEALHGGVQDAGYRNDYEELPRTEKYGKKGQEDLPDADGAVDAERLAADNKIVRDFNKSAVVRAARSKAMERIDAELSSRQGAGDFSFGANVDPSAPSVEPIPVQAFDYMKRGLDDVIESKTRSGGMGANEARVLRDQLRGARNLVDATHPDYAAARGGFAGDEELKTAFDLGRNVFKAHPDETVLAVNGMGAGEKELFRRGGLEALADRVENRAPGRNPADVAAKTMDQKRLRLLFDTPQEFAQFQKRLSEEATMHRTRTAIQGGSQTADKASELLDMAGMSPGAVVDLATGHAGGLIRRGMHAVAAKTIGKQRERIVERNAEQLANRFTAGMQNRQDLVDMLNAAETGVAARAAQPVSRASAATATAIQRTAPRLAIPSSLSTPEVRRLPAAMTPSEADANSDQRRQLLAKALRNP